MCFVEKNNIKIDNIFLFHHFVLFLAVYAASLLSPHSMTSKKNNF